MVAPATASLQHPRPPAGYRYDLSILQAEFSLTQIWDQAVSGRCFFEEIIRENIDLGRPEQVQLIFSRKMNKSTVADGRCRTRIITEGVIPSLHIYYKSTQGFRNRDLRPLLAQASGLDTQQITQAKMSYDLRRLRLHGLIERITGTHRYQLTALGRRTALFYSRAFNRIVRPGLSHIAHPNLPPERSKLTAAFHHLEVQLTKYFTEKKAA